MKICFLGVCAEAITELTLRPGMLSVEDNRVRKPSIWVLARERVVFVLTVNILDIKPFCIFLEVDFVEHFFSGIVIRKTYLARFCLSEKNLF